MQSVSADASGQVKVEYTVSKGPFGANNIVCGRARACLVSVTQATLAPTRDNSGSRRADQFRVTEG